MKHISLLILFGLFTSVIFAQDKHFSQFYASPMAMNPALAGAFDGKFRVGAIYRDQWRGALDNPFVTFSRILGHEIRYWRSENFSRCCGWWNSIFHRPCGWIGILIPIKWH